MKNMAKLQKILHHTLKGNSIQASRKCHSNVLCYYYELLSQRIAQVHLFFGESDACFSFALFVIGGRTTTCIVMTPPGSSPINILDSPSV
eukprot:c15562_g1_i1 orf=2-268(-)